ncbi:MAG: hypothetical protein PHH09_05065 [Methanoregulaceae archaeon]|nr:hypothetical protein [Methanoregulaceae archaeon]
MVSKQVRRALLASQIHRQQNELELWTAAAAGQTISPRIDFPAQYAGRVYWQISDGTVKPATSGAEISHTFAANGPHRVRLIGVPVAELTRIDAQSDYLTGDIGKIRWNLYRNLVTLYLYSTSVSGDISNLAGLSNLAYLNLAITDVSGDISNLAGLSNLEYLYLYSNDVSGDISNLAGLSKLVTMHLAITDVSGDISNLAGLSNLAYVYLYSTSATCSSTFTASWVGMRDFQVQNCLMSQAAVGNVIESIWDARARFTYATPALNVGGTNAAPSGHVAAPPGDGESNSDWYWDGEKYIPLTAGAMIWDLAKDVNSEDFKKWAITYNGGSI